MSHSKVPIKLRALARLFGVSVDTLSYQEDGFGLNLYQTGRGADLILESPYSSTMTHLYYYTREKPDFSLFRNLTSLTHLNLILPNSPLIAIPEEILELKHLRVLDISGCGIEEISVDISNLSELVCLGLGTNRLRRLPDSIGDLTNLEHLYLYNNYLESIPSSLNELPNLTMLGLKKNPISQLPPELTKKPHLFVRSHLSRGSKRYSSSSRPLCYYFLGQSPVKIPKANTINGIYVKK